MDAKMNDQLLGPLLAHKESVPCTTFTIDACIGSVPMDMVWALICDDKDRWRAYRQVYMINKDNFVWTPLAGDFDSPGSAQAAVKEFIRRRRPLFLDKHGELTHS